MTVSPSAPRQRGAQPGNTNARKHGFYSSRLLPDEVKDLDDFEPVDMSGEIDLIRTQLRRLLEDANAQPSSFQQRIDLIRVICIAVRSLSRLIRTHNNIYPKDEIRTAELRLMADEIRQDLENHVRVREEKIETLRALEARLNAAKNPDLADPNHLNTPTHPASSSVSQSPARPALQFDPDDPEDTYVLDSCTNPAFVHPMDVQDF